MDMVHIFSLHTSYVLKIVLTRGYRTIEEKLRKQISVEGKCDTAYVILCDLSVGAWQYHREASCVLRCRQLAV
jgi:hypothetical protein